MKVMFYVAKQYSLPIVQPLLKSCRDQEINCAFFVSEKVRELLPPEFRRYPVFFNYKSAKSFRPDFVLSPGNFVDYRLSGVKVQLFHGLGVEKDSHYQIRHFFDVYCTSGPYVTDRFKRLQKKHRYFIVRETGWPKIDHILNYQTENLRKKYGIPQKRRVILYAPTFSRRMESASDLLPVLPQMIRPDEYWILKFHELMDRTLLKPLTHQKSENFQIIDTFDITPLLHIADVLISDTSSVVYEFMALQKPVVTYRTQDRPDKCINITEPRQLRAALEQAISEGCSQNIAREMRAINPYLDGKISERVINVLKEIETNPAVLPRKRKPLNLGRKLQILYHERFRKGYIR